MHFIREETLKRFMLRRIFDVTAMFFEDIMSFQKAVYEQRFEEAEKAARKRKREIAQAEKRIAELDRIFKRIYEDDISGAISHERFLKLSAEYEAEQKELTEKVKADREMVNAYEQDKADFDSFAAVIRKYVGITELTPTIVNEFVKKIIVHAPDKSSGHRRQMNLVKIVRAQYGGLPVAATHSLALRRQMLEHHGHSPAADLAAMLTLHTGNDGLAHAGGHQRVLAEAFLATAPTRVAGDVQTGYQCNMNTAGCQFRGDCGFRFLHSLRIECGTQSQIGGQHRAAQRLMPVRSLFAEQYADAMCTALQHGLLHHGNRLRPFLRAYAIAPMLARPRVSSQQAVQSAKPAPPVDLLLELV